MGRHSHTEGTEKGVSVQHVLLVGQSVARRRAPGRTAQRAWLWHTLIVPASPGPYIGCECVPSHQGLFALR